MSSHTRVFKGLLRAKARTDGSITARHATYASQSLRKLAMRSSRSPSLLCVAAKHIGYVECRIEVVTASVKRYDKMRNTFVASASSDATRGDSSVMSPTTSRVSWSVKPDTNRNLSMSHVHSMAEYMAFNHSPRAILK